MTSAPMTTKELLELAALDALGLLDRYEAAIYTRSFHDAPVPVQDEITRLQAEVVADERLVPDEEPNPALRERVLKAVADAIAREEARLAPLATIGRRRAAETGAGRSPFAAGSTSGQFWRAASFVLAGAWLVMLYFFSQGFQSSNQLTRAVFNYDTGQLQLLLGDRAKDFLLDDSGKITLTATDEESDVRACLYVDDTSNEILILHEGLPRADDGAYVLQVLRKDGMMEQILAFGSNGAFNGVKAANLRPDLVASVALWQIADLASGTVLLSGA